MPEPPELELGPPVSTIPVEVLVSPAELEPPVAWVDELPPVVAPVVGVPLVDPVVLTLPSLAPVVAMESAPELDSEALADPPASCPEHPRTLAKKRSA